MIELIGFLVLASIAIAAVYLSERSLKKYDKVADAFEVVRTYAIAERTFREELRKACHQARLPAKVAEMLELRSGGEIINWLVVNNVQPIDRKEL